MQIRYDFSISDLLLRVESSRKIRIPDNFAPFLIDSPPTQNPDLILQFLFEQIPEVSGDEFANLTPERSRNDFPISETFQVGRGEYIIRQDSSGRGSPCRIFIPPGFAETFCTQGNWQMFIGLERMLIEFDRFFLHASAVIHEGRAYIFSAASGVGKSTHAALWQQHFGAKLLNGDKVLIHVRDGRCMAYGSPVAGSSGIFEADGAPIAAVYFLEQAKENRISPMPPRSALLQLYSEAIKLGKEPAFNVRLLDLIEKLRSQVPVRTLACLPEKSAVECVLQKEGMIIL